MHPADPRIEPVIDSVASVWVNRPSRQRDYSVDDDDSDQSFGYYANAGALFRIGRHLNVGVDLLWIGGTDINLLGVSGDANSFVGSVFVGFGWD